jgi:hypothetical protein
LGFTDALRCHVKVQRTISELTMIPSSSPGLAAIIVSKKRKKIIAAFRSAGATSAPTAKSLTELGLHQSLLLHIQRWRGIILPAGNERFYLDEQAEKRRHAFVIKLLAVSVIAVLVIAAFTYSMKFS